MPSKIITGSEADKTLKISSGIPNKKLVSGLALNNIISQIDIDKCILKNKDMCRIINFSKTTMSLYNSSGLDEHIDIYGTTIDKKIPDIMMGQTRNYLTHDKINHSVLVLEISFEGETSQLPEYSISCVSVSSNQRCSLFNGSTLIIFPDNIESPW